MTDGPVVGVDEAGKGPVIGSMFAAAVRVPDPVVLPDEVADSKRLTAERRETLAEQLRAHPQVRVGVAEVGVERIDDPATDMNGLAVAGQSEAVAPVVGDGDRVLADACDTSESRFAGRLADRLADRVDVAVGTTVDEADGTAVDEAQDAAVDVRAEHGADGAHAVVAAASVLAKVARDDHVAALAADHPELVDGHGDLGSGYPSDPTTRAFLERYVAEHGAVPPFARSSWSTCEQLLAERQQAALEEF